MAKSGSNASEPGMTTERIAALTDGIFAVAMTLLVLTINVPEAGKSAAQIGLHNLLIGQMDKFVNYAVSFIILAVFWMEHHQQFHFIKRTDAGHLWINIFSLMFVALVPFSTSLRGDYPDHWVSGIFFASNLFVVGILYLWGWVYATKGHRLVDPSLDRQRIALSIRLEAVTPLVALLAMGLSVVAPGMSSYVYLLIPILLRIGGGLSRGAKGG